jgi:hypothetical protein
MEMETMTDNELIAVFMDAKNWGHENPYDTSWDWLIPVIQKIDSMYNMDQTSILEDAIYSKVLTLSITVKIEDAYSEVVDFIKWYNQQSKNGNN